MQRATAAADTDDKARVDDTNADRAGLCIRFCRCAGKQQRCRYESGTQFDGANKALHCDLPARSQSPLKIDPARMSPDGSRPPHDERTIGQIILGASRFGDAFLQRTNTTIEAVRVLV